MKRWLLTANLAAAPFIALAGDPLPRYDVVDVEYWGTFGSCRADDCSWVPSKLYGLLRIDLSRAPPDSFPETEWRGQYASLGSRRGFVTSSELPALRGGSSFDIVSVTDGPQLLPNDIRIQDSYSVGTLERIVRRGETVAEGSLHVSFGAPGHWAVAGDAMTQQFDVRAADVDGRGFGLFDAIRHGVRLGYSFMVDRLRVTPKVCRR